MCPAYHWFSHDNFKAVGKIQRAKRKRACGHALASRAMASHSHEWLGRNLKSYLTASASAFVKANFLGCHVHSFRFQLTDYRKNHPFRHSKMSARLVFKTENLSNFSATIFCDA